MSNDVLVTRNGVDSVMHYPKQMNACRTCFNHSLAVIKPCKGGKYNT